MANQFLALSLFLMLLSFFLIMNGVSGFDSTKARPALNSIALAFSTSKSRENRAPYMTESLPMSMGEGDTLEGVEGIFSAHIANFQATKNRLGTEMQMRVPAEVFEKSINEVSQAEDHGTDGQAQFLPTLVTLLRSEKKGMPYRMDMIVHVPSDPSDFMISDPPRFATVLRQVSGFGKILEDTGLPRHLMSVGMERGEPGYVLIRFQKYESYNPLEQGGG